MNLFYQPLIPQGVRYLDNEESRHCIKVLRKTTGDPISITDGNGFFYDAQILKADPHQCTFEIKNQVEEKKKSCSIHIAIAPTKSADRIEWFVEKATEIGIDQITLLECKNSERSFLKTERLKKVCISAMKQSVKAKLPSINEIIPFDKFLEQHLEEEKFIAFVDNQNPIHLKEIAPISKNYIVMIGPEGDFTKNELEHALNKGFKKVSLGQSRLRTETAGIVACHILNLIN